MKVTKISGPQGSGKTTLFNAMTYVMGGKVINLPAGTTGANLAGLVAKAPTEAMFLLDGASDIQVQELQTLGYSTQFAYVIVEEVIAR